MQQIMIHFYNDGRETVVIKGSTGHVESYWNGNAGHLITLFMNGKQLPSELPIIISHENARDLQEAVGKLLWSINQNALNPITKSITLNASELSQYLNNISIRLTAAPRVTDGHINSRFDNIKEQPKKFTNSFQMVVQYDVWSLQSMIAIELLECIRRNIKILRCICGLWYVKKRNIKTCGLCPPPAKTPRHKMPDDERNLERFKGNLDVYIKRQAAKKSLNVKSFINNRRNEIEVINHMKKYIDTKGYLISETEIKYWLNKLKKKESE